MGPRRGSPLDHGHSGGPAALPGCKGQLDRRGDRVVQQSPADRHQRHPVSVLPAVDHLRAEDRRSPQQRSAHSLRPGGHLAGGDHRCLCQLASGRQGPPQGSSYLACLPHSAHLELKQLFYLMDPGTWAPDLGVFALVFPRRWRLRSQQSYLLSFSFLSCSMG